MLVHATAILNDEPIRSDRLSRPLPPMTEECWLGQGVCVGPYAVIQRDVVVGDGSMVGTHARIFTGARIGNGCLIGAAVEIGRNARIGANVKILANAHICGGTTIGDGSVIGMGVITTDDDNPLVWEEKVRRPVTIGEKCQIGAGAIPLPGVEIGDNAIRGAAPRVRWAVKNGVLYLRSQNGEDRQYDLSVGSDDDVIRLNGDGYFVDTQNECE